MSIIEQDMVSAGANAWASAMQSYASVWPKADLQSRPGYTTFWANSPFTLWNGLMLSDRNPQHGQLCEAIAQASGFMQAKTEPGLLYACREFLPGLDLEQIMRDAGFEPKLGLRGMEASDLSPLSPRDDTALRFARVDNEDVGADFAAVISETYGYPLEVCRAEFEGNLYWREQAYAIVGYEGSEPVATSSIIVSEGALYVGLVATRKDFRNRGYSHATNARLLHDTANATGIGRAVLHATDAGFPVYEKLGFSPTMTLTGFGRIVEDDTSGGGIA